VVSRAKRFRCFREGASWTVWDDNLNQAAQLGGSDLVGRGQQHAEAACGILERIYQNGLDASAPQRAGFKRVLTP
jgi:hypothetical protein